MRTGREAPRELAARHGAKPMPSKVEEQITGRLRTSMDNASPQPPIRGDLDAFRRAFPITARRAYLFSGGLAPAATPVREALDAWVEHWTWEPLYHRARYFEASEHVRASLSRLLR